MRRRAWKAREKRAFHQRVAPMSLVKGEGAEGGIIYRYVDGGARCSRSEYL